MRRGRIARIAVSALWAATLVACPSEDKSESLTKALQTRLADREARLARYRLAARVEQAGQPTVEFDFTYRSPGRMRGRMFRPDAQILSFDGETLYEVTPAKKTFRRFKVPTAPAQRVLWLAGRFAPFVPEGFRPPLLPWKSAHAVAVAHPRAPQAVAVKAQLKDDTGQPLIVTYTLRWPSGDFLVKRLEGSGGVVELRVDDEQCEKQLDICVPLRLSQWKDGVKVATTEITELELFEAPPVEDFSLRPPEGFSDESADL